EVLDTQMFGLQKEVDFAVKLGLVDREDGKQIMLRLEKELSKLHEAFTLVYRTYKVTKEDEIEGLRGEDDAK
ncbi:DUF1507 family protein, partial [Staphylococcus aureus]|uniref:DUF1507 family protein n=1 Tax=Staphylococcus aureus TaxID=1280 RepID=UPI001F5BC1B3